MMSLKAVAAGATIAGVMGFAALGLGAGVASAAPNLPAAPATQWAQDHDGHGWGHGHGDGDWGGGGWGWGGGENWGGGDNWGGGGWGGPGAFGCLNAGVVFGCI